MADGADTLGDLTTAGLLVAEVERAGAGLPAVGHDEHESCANCGTIRMGEYCHRCGQAGHVHRDLGALVHDVAHGVFHFEGRIWRTLPLLAWHPGRLTRRYVDGERARFVSPMALFLFSVFLMFAVVANLPGQRARFADVTGQGNTVATQVAKKEARIARLRQERAAATDADTRADLDGDIADEVGEAKALRQFAWTETRPGQPGYKPLDRSNVNTGWARLDELIIHAARNPDLLLYKMKTYGYKYSWALIPISLPFIWLLCAFRRDVGLYDHAIFSIYSLSFMSLAVVVLAVGGALGLPGVVISSVATVVPPVHMYRQLKGTYRLGRWGAGWRTAALLCITLVTSTLYLLLLFWLGAE